MAGVLGPGYPFRFITEAPSLSGSALQFSGESAYLLLNRRALAQDDLLRHAAAMFDALYLMPGGLHPSAGPPEPAGVG
jgi:hypothetical protein